MPDDKTVGAEKQKPAPRIPLDLTNLAKELGNRYISVRWDEVRQRMNTGCLSMDMEWIHKKEANEHPELIPMLLWEELRPFYTGVTVNNVEMLMEITAKSNPTIPPLDEVINPKNPKSPFAGTWKAGDPDYIGGLFPLMHIDPDDTLSQTLIRKWFYQGIVLLQNTRQEPYGADGVLVLQGDAGVGKTSFFRYAAMRPEWFVEGGRISEYDKDFLRRLLNGWISELGELERSVNESTMNTFKALVTNRFDAYRLPYGRQDIETPRRTNLCATCNSIEFITDNATSRRCWIIPIKQRMLIEALAKYPWELVWKQAYAIVQQNRECFRLTPQEQQQLLRRNRGYTVQLPAEQECMDILDHLSDSDREAFYTTATDFKAAYPAELSKYTAKQVSAALQAYGLVAINKRVDGKKGRWLMFPADSNN